MFVTLGGVLLGFGARYVFPRRQTYGSLLVPAISAVVAAVIWEALTWAGWKYDGGWIWWVALVASGVSATIAALVIGRVRSQADVARLDRLSRA